MSEFSLPLATSTWDEAEYCAMQRVIERGQFTMGPEVKAFEQAFSEYHKTKYSVMVNSGSSANLLMIAALFFRKNNPLRPGDEVIVPAVSWSTSYTPLQQYGLKVKFVDIDLYSLNIDLDQLEEAITAKTRLILMVNLLGNPNDFCRLDQIIRDRDVVILEDNCESLGAELDGKKTGTFGLMGSYSSFFSHHISTMEGGVVTTDDQELYHIMLSLRAHGWTRDLPKHNNVTQTKSDNVFDESFKFVLPGYNLRPLELSGAVGVEQVKKLPAIVDGRRRNAAYFQELMGGHSQFIIQRETGKSSWFGFSLVLRPNADMTRDELRVALSELGFECRPIVAGNFTKNAVMRFFDAEIHGCLENADHIHRHGLFIGNHHFNIKPALNLLSQL
jgi:CDP-6-deoxy-D-xylo-4-hexulose-3-dehydrase